MTARKIGKNTGNAGKGRPKGSRNKTTSAAKAVIEEAAKKLGGAARMVEWAQESATNERVFWGTIYPKLLPHQVEGPDGGPLQVVIRRFADE